MEFPAAWMARFGGETAALGAAFLWALASVCFRLIGQSIPPVRMNLLKNILAGLLFAATLAAAGGVFTGLDRRSTLIFLASGALGIGVGDSAYFGALQALGARRALLMLVLAPPLTALLSLLFLGEGLSRGAWLGMLATTAGVAWVISERTSSGGLQQTPSLAGIGLGGVAVLGQSAGAVLSHAAFMQSGVDPMQSALLRLAGGTVMVVLLLPLDRRRQRRGDRPPLAIGRWPLIGFTVFTGTYLGLWLQQTSLKLTTAGVAQTLLSTSPLFVLPIAALSGERVSPRAVCGALLAVGGVALLFALQ